MSVQVQLWPRGIQRTKTSGPLGVDFDGETARVGRSVYASDIGRLVSVNVSSRYEDGFGGTDLVKFRIVPNGGFIGGMFRPGDHVRVTNGGGTVAEAEMSEPVPQPDGTVEFTAKGYAYNLLDYDSVAVFDAGESYPTTLLTNPGVPADPLDKFGWEYATEVLGMPINQVVGDPGIMAAYTGTTWAAEQPVKIGPVLTEACRLGGVRWAVWGRSLVLAEDPTTPKWQIEAPQGLVGTADTDYATHVGVWYVVDDNAPEEYDDLVVYDGGDRVFTRDGGNYLWWTKNFDTVAGVAPGDTVTVGSTTFQAWIQVPHVSGESEWRIAWAIQDTDGINKFDAKTVVVDYRGNGYMSTPEALAIAQGLLDQVKGRFVLSGSFTVAPGGGLTSANGGYAGDALAFVRAGDGIQLNHVRATQSNLLDGFQIIGKTDWSWDATSGPDGGEQLTITLMGTVARNLGTILAGIPLGTAG